MATRLALGLTLLLSADLHPDARVPAPLAALPVHAAAVAAGEPNGRSGVDVEFRRVDFHLEEGIVLHIERLRGELVPTSASKPPTFDDKSSFTLHIASADMAIDTASLATLLNRHVFGYRGAPLRKLAVHTEGNQLVQTGVIHKGVDMPFKIHATLSLTPDGRIRMHPTSVRVGGIGMKRVMRAFGIELDDVIKVQPGRGATLDGNDVVLDALAALPLPRIRGRLTSIGIGPGGVTQTFTPESGKSVAALRTPTANTPNFMFFRHGTLRFGKLTMADADLLILDASPKDRFDFSLDRYNDQLVAGHSNSTRDLGLVVHMPDLHAVGARKVAAAAGK